MTLKAVVGYSENVESSFAAGKEIGDMILKHMMLQEFSVGLLFCSVEFNYSELIRGIREILPIPIIGCTAASVANQYGYFEDSASLMVITSENVQFGIGLGTRLSVDPQTAVDEAFRQSECMLNGATPKLAIVFPDTTLKSSADQVIEYMRRHLPECPIIGGVPGDNFTFQNASQYVNNDIETDSVPVLLIAGEIDPVVVTRGGWVPIGRKAVATKAQGNLLYEIDCQPAVDYLGRYIPTIEDPEILGSYPLAIHLTSGELDESNFMIRSPHSYDAERQCIIYQGDIPENSIVQLAYGTREDILKGAEDAAATLLDRLEGRSLNCLLFFSCAGRKLMLGLETEKEKETICTFLPFGTPMNGFYSYGEIGPNDWHRTGITRANFHNTSLILCAL